jgi:hypothetical protein
MLSHIHYAFARIFDDAVLSLSQGQSGLRGEREKCATLLLKELVHDD